MLRKLSLACFRRASGNLLNLDVVQLQMTFCSRVMNMTTNVEVLFYFFFYHTVSASEWKMPQVLRAVLVHLLSVFYDSTVWVRTPDQRCLQAVQARVQQQGPNAYSCSCTLPGQLFMQQHNKAGQCPDQSWEAVSNFDSGWGWVFSLFCFLNQLHVCISIWCDADMRTRTGVEDRATQKSTAILRNCHGNRA